MRGGALSLSPPTLYGAHCSLAAVPGTHNLGEVSVVTPVSTYCCPLVVVHTDPRLQEDGLPTSKAAPE